MEKEHLSKHCAFCHMEDGSGLEEVVPALDFDIVKVRELGLIQCIIRNGVENQKAVFKMIPNKEISDIDITNVINYLLNDINHLDTIVNLNQTKLALSKCSEVNYID